MRASWPSVVEAHRLTLTSCLVEYGPDQSASYAAALMARQQFTKPDESLLAAVVDVQPGSWLASMSPTRTAVVNRNR
jgi:hypothetical protein